MTKRASKKPTKKQVAVAWANVQRTYDRVKQLNPSFSWGLGHSMKMMLHHAPDGVFDESFELDSEEMARVARANVERVHKAAVTTERNHRFDMTIQDTAYLMFHYKGELFDESFELPVMIGPVRDKDYDTTEGIPSQLLFVTIH